MRLKDFEEKVMEKAKHIDGFRILSFRLRHCHVRRCLGRNNAGDVFVWDGFGVCHARRLDEKERLLDDDEFVNRYDLASTAGWSWKPEYDIQDAGVRPCHPAGKPFTLESRPLGYEE